MSGKTNKRFWKQSEKLSQTNNDDKVTADMSQASMSVKQERSKWMSGFNDVVDLNVGGEKMSTTRSTLCQVKGSLLASMFSKGQEDRLKPDKDGCIFLDFNPQQFGLILDYLRCKMLEAQEDLAPIPVVDQENSNSFNYLVRRLGLAAEFLEKTTREIKASGVIYCHSEKISIEGKNGAFLRHDSREGHAYAATKEIYSEGKIVWKIKMDSYMNWLFIGVVKGDTKSFSDTSFQSAGVYGWALGAKGGEVYRDGDCEDCGCNYRCKKGCVINLTLDILAANLTISWIGMEGLGERNFSRHLELPQSPSWRLLINMGDACSRICML